MKSPLGASDNGRFGHTLFNRRVFLQSGLVALASSKIGLGHSFVQDEEEGWPELSPEAVMAYGRFDRAIADIDGFLRAIGFQKNAIIGANVFGVSVGGVDAFQDLEEGRGVDPETFAALHSGFAVPEVAQHLNLKQEVIGGGAIQLKITSNDGRLRYKNSAVRMYSPSRMRELFERREAFRLEDDKKRKVAFTEYVLGRKGDDTVEDAGDGRNEVSELADRYRVLQPLAEELDTFVRTEAGNSSIIENDSLNYFALSLGGLNVQANFTADRSIDPESFGAVIARKLTSDLQDAIQITNGRVTYNEGPIRLYSMERLEGCFKHRQRLQQQSAGA